MPGLTAMCLALLADFSIGKVAAKPEFGEDEVKAHVAWSLSMLVACLGMWLFFVAASCIALLREFGVIPSFDEEEARQAGKEDGAAER
jgi:hypothetical protein